MSGAVPARIPQLNFYLPSAMIARRTAMTVPCGTETGLS